MSAAFFVIVYMNKLLSYVIDENSFDRMIEIKEDCDFSAYKMEQTLHQTITNRRTGFFGRIMSHVEQTETCFG